MRAWLAASSTSARLVSDAPTLWLSGALAWTVGLGWIPFVLAVARPPTEVELAFMGAGLVTSGTWPWNAVLLSAVVLAVVIGGYSLVAVANANLLATASGRRPATGHAVRQLAIALVAAVPLLAAAAGLTVAAALVVAREFNNPEPGPGGPVLGIVGRIAPVIALVIAAAVFSSVVSVAAGWHAIRYDAGVRSSLAASLRALARLGPAAVAHALATPVVHLLFLVLGGLLMAVLWAPIGAAMDAGASFDLVAGLLLVGFVGIWICLILAGGALHAWSAMTWARLFARHHWQPGR